MKVRATAGEGKIKLSVGMIVKDEEKRLRGCLEALQPLFAQASCELIIADTGSTDGTKEIAKEFADVFFELEWQGDFSQARNATLERASGEWFMFIDADEYLVDADKMAAFFNSEEQKGYNLGTYLIRSYTDQRHTAYKDFRAVRMCRRSTGNHFYKKIHESLYVTPPIKHLDVLVDHFGYVYETEEQMERKRARNLKILQEELQKEPDDPRLLVHMADSSKPGKQREYLEKALKNVRTHPDHPYFGGVYQRLAQNYINDNRMADAVQLLEEYFKRKNPGVSVVDLDLCAFYAVTLGFVKQYEKAVPVFAKYFELYEQYGRGEINQDYLMFGWVKYNHPHLHNEQLLNAAKCHHVLKQHDKALSLFLQIDYAQSTPFEIKENFFPFFFKLVEDAGDYTQFAACYRRILESGKVETARLYIELMEKFLSLHQQACSKTVHAIAQLEAEDDYVDLCRLLDGKSPSRVDRAQLEKLLAEKKDWRAGGAELIYLALRQGVDICPLLEKLDAETMESTLSLSAESHKDFAKVVLDYVKPGLTDTMRGLLFMTTARAHAVKDSGGLDTPDRLALYRVLVDDLTVYVTNLYNPQLFNDQDMAVLPALHRFGYFMGCAALALQEGDELGYVRSVHTALKNCAKMKDVVALLLEDFEKHRDTSRQQEEADRERRRQQAQRHKELEKSAAAFKEKINVLLAGGYSKEAAQAVEAYAKINPGDPDLPGLREKTGL